jgi:hypothetical protein
MKILLVGVGGIGSYLAEHIALAYGMGQIPLDWDFCIADGDNVEIKNITYQNFTGADIGKMKVKAMEDKLYDKCYLSTLDKYIEEKDLKGFDIIILAVDNMKTRSIVIDYCHKNDKMFIDLRAEGRMVFGMMKGANKEDDLATLDMKDTTSGSCQLQEDIDKDRIQYGNLIIAAMGLQLLVNFIRNKEQGRRILLKI